MATADDSDVTDSHEDARDPVDAILLVSFGGPEGPDDVLPFLQNVTRGRGIPDERLIEVGAHYDLFGGVSPINGQNRLLLAALREHLPGVGVDLPVYWGNRNWDPLLTETVRQMSEDGVRRALAFVTSAFSSYSGCRQYRENIEQAQRTVGDSAPVIEKLRVFYNHPGFVEPQAERARSAMVASGVSATETTRLVFTAHSIPMSMADSSDYVKQLRGASALVADRVDGSLAWDLVFQSRSGPPQVPWLEPDVCDHLRTLATEGVETVVMIPIGFISDHMEVIYDLDTEALEVATELGLTLVRVPTVGVDPEFVAMIGDLITERLEQRTTRVALGASGASHDVCPLDCCPAPQRPARPQN